MALGVITFIGSWNAFLWPLIIGQTPNMIEIDTRVLPSNHPYLADGAKELADLLAKRPPDYE